MNEVEEESEETKPVTGLGHCKFRFEASMMIPVVSPAKMMVSGT
jgi:hypothetical protein